MFLSCADNYVLLIKEYAAAEIAASLGHFLYGPAWRVGWGQVARHRTCGFAITRHRRGSRQSDGLSETAYTQLREGRRVQLPPKTTSFKRWAEKLVEFSQSNSLTAEKVFWRVVSEADLVSLPTDHPPHGENSEASVKTITLALDADATKTLLQEVPAVYNTQINDVLLAALTQAMGCWLGAGWLLVDLEGHGREEIAEGLDLSHTVGWFTSIFPLRLDLAPAAGVRETLLAVKEQLRRIPQRGIGYGVLRYLSGDAELAAQPQAPVVFNYLGQFDQVLAGSTLFGFARESAGPWHSPQARRRHQLEINSLIVGGKLELRWNFSENIHRHETIHRVAEDFLSALHGIIEHCQSPEAGGCTPSDFPLTRLSQATLDRLVKDAAQHRRHLPAHPHSAFVLRWSRSNATSVSINGTSPCTVRSTLPRCKRHGKQVFSRHTILRSSFVAQGLPEPVQMVHRRLKPAWNELDWRGLDVTTQTERLREFLRTDRELGFDPAKPPLTRNTVIRLADDRNLFVWAHHHLQIDGWSWPLIFKEVSTIYEALRRKQAPSLPPARPYRDYLVWLQRQDIAGAEKFWRQTLQGFTEPTPLPGGFADFASATAGAGERQAALDAKVTGELQALARVQRVTLGTLVQAAWALLLARSSGRHDVVFGGTFSGRPADLPGVESIAGPFVNNLPVRVSLSEGEPLSQFLEKLHAHTQELSQHQFTPLLQLQSWSEMPSRHRLFNSLLVFQNYSVDEAAWRLGSDVEIRDFVAPVRTNYPLTLVVTPGAELQIDLIYQGAQSDAAARILERLSALLRVMPGALSQPVENLLAIVPATELPKSQSVRTPAASMRNYVAPRTEMERAIAKIWQDAFQMERVGIEENFFDLGGHSLLMVQVHARLRAALGADLSIVTAFRYPTIRSLAKHLTADGAASSGLRAKVHARAASSRGESSAGEKKITDGAIAIVGLTGRFPGAENVDEFWQNLIAGVESISTFSDDELAAAGLDVSALDAIRATCARAEF